jgi:hypothetical protein
MLKETRASDRDRAIIAGHYVFSRPEVLELKREAASALATRGVDLEQHLQKAVKASILRYLRHFRLLTKAH